MASKTMGSFWKRNGALESLSSHEVASKGASPGEQPVLSLDPGLSFGRKIKVTGGPLHCGRVSVPVFCPYPCDRERNTSPVYHVGVSVPRLC